MRHLSLQGFDQLSDVKIACHNLTSVSAPAALHSLHLSLPGFNQLSDVKIACHNLTSVSATAAIHSLYVTNFGSHIVMLDAIGLAVAYIVLCSS